MIQSPLQIEMFGGLRVCLPGQAPVEMPPQQTGALLAYLALHSGRQHTREELAEIFWPEEEPETSRSRLRHALHALRRQLEQPPFEKESVLVATRATVHLNPALIRTDVAAFEEAIQTAGESGDPATRIGHLVRAVGLYRGNLLPGYYQDGFLTEQRRYADLFWKALNRLRQAYEEAGDLEHALECGRRAVSLDPLSEEAHCALMRLYAAMGQTSALLRQFQELERILKEQLGIAPSVETCALLETLRQNISQNGSQNGHSQGQTVRTNGSTSPHIDIRTESEPLPISSPSTRTPSPALPAPTSRLPLWPRWVFILMVLLALNGLFLGWLTFRPRTVGTAASPLGSLSPTPVPAAKEIWKRRYQPESDESDPKGSEPTATAADAAGNIYITGFVHTTKNDVDFLTLKYDPNGNLLWRARYNGPGNDVDRARSIAVDKDGNVYVTGESDNGKGNGKTRLCGLDFATVKYDKDGRQVWERRYNGPGDGEDWAKRIALDDAGNVYVGGYAVQSKAAGYLFHPTILKYDADGNQKWIKSYSPEKGLYSKQGMYATLTDMKVDGAGNIYIIGIEETKQHLIDNLDYLTVKYDTHGAVQWQKSYGGPGNGDDTPFALALDRAGNVYVTGRGYNGDSVHGGTGDDFVTLKYSMNGVELWKKSYHGGSGDAPHALAVDAAGNVYVTGEINPGAISSDFATVMYDTNGLQKWAKQCNGLRNGSDAPQAIAVDSAGQIFVTGSFYDGHPDDNDGTIDDYATLKYDAQGNCLWLGLYNGPARGTDRAYAIAIDSHGDIIVTGQSNDGRFPGIFTIKYKP